MTVFVFMVDNTGRVSSPDEHLSGFVSVEAHEGETPEQARKRLVENPDNNLLDTEVLHCGYEIQEDE